ncbi:hypothetical protein ACFQY5_08605 [Paeniroseomonas aquatica]|uniref:hypothetical protein n=1 Tax=Paeniroseomonas aquatica TaxID=373043 RepID=UPI0036221C70
MPSSFASSQPWNSVPGVRMRRTSAAMGWMGQGPATVSGPRTWTARPASLGAMVQVVASSAQCQSPVRPAGSTGSAGARWKVVQVPASVSSTSVSPSGGATVKGKTPRRAARRPSAVAASGKGTPCWVAAGPGENSTVAPLSASSQRPARPSSFGIGGTGCRPGPAAISSIWCARWCTSIPPWLAMAMMARSRSGTRRKQVLKPGQSPPWSTVRRPR